MKQIQIIRKPDNIDNYELSVCRIIYYLASHEDIYMKKIILLILLLIPSNVMADDFDTFLKKFFDDSDFQKNHISYPIPGHISYICDSNPEGTCEEEKIFAKDSSKWEHLGYGYGKPGVIYKKSNKCPDKLPNASNCIYIELSEDESDFNLHLYFIKEKDTLNLIYLWYFEP